MKRQDKRDAFTGLGFMVLLLLAVTVWSAVTGKWSNVITFIISLAAAVVAVLALRLLRKLAHKIWP